MRILLEIARCRVVCLYIDSRGLEKPTFEVESDRPTTVATLVKSEQVTAHFGQSSGTGVSGRLRVLALALGVGSELPSLAMTFSAVDL